MSKWNSLQLRKFWGIFDKCLVQHYSSIGCMEESWFGIVDTVVWIYWGNIIKAAYFSFIVYNLIWLFRKNRFSCDTSRSHWWKWKSVFQTWLGSDLNLVTMAMAVTTLRIESQTSSRSPRVLCTRRIVFLFQSSII